VFRSSLLKSFPSTTFLAGTELLIRWTAVVSYFLCLWYLLDASSSFSDGPHLVEDALYKYRGCFVCLPFFSDASFSAVPLGLRKVGLDVFLFSPEVASPDLFLLVELSWDRIRREWA